MRPDFEEERRHLVHQQDFLTCFLRVRWATPAALETVACDQITYKLADVARSLRTILLNFFIVL